MICHFDCGCMKQYRRSRLVAQVECGREGCKVPPPASADDERADQPQLAHTS